MKTIKTKQENN